VYKDQKATQRKYTATSISNKKNHTENKKQKQHKKKRPHQQRALRRKIREENAVSGENVEHLPSSE